MIELAGRRLAVESVVVPLVDSVMSSLMVEWVDDDPFAPFIMARLSPIPGKTLGTTTVVMSVPHGDCYGCSGPTDRGSSGTNISPVPRSHETVRHIGCPAEGNRSTKHP